MKIKFKKHLINLIKIILAGAIVYWLLTSGKIDLSVFKMILTPYYGFVCLLLTFFSLFIGSERWRVLLKNQGLHSNPIKAFKLTLIGVFFNFAMPGGVGGDVIKGYYLTKNHPEQKVKAALTVLMDRIIGLYAMIIMALAAMFFDYSHIMLIPQMKSIFSLLALIWLMATIGLGLAFSDRLKKSNLIDSLIKKLPWSKRLHTIYISIHSYGHKPAILFQTIFLSFLTQIMSILLMINVGHAMGETTISWITYMIVVPIGFMVTAIPIAPAGVGIGQAAFYFLFNSYLGKTSDVGPTIITVFQIMVFLFGLLGSFFYIRIKTEKTTA